jgi:HAD superfamily hydrolase (TIGR01549 family)
MDLYKNIHTVIWDYDGTLADTRQKNLNVTKQIVAKITGTNSNQYPALQSLANYSLAINRAANWKDLYEQEFNFSDEQIEIAGKLWTKYQDKDKTLVAFYKGISDVIRELGHFRHGIVSQNSRHIISEQLKENKIADYFDSVIGYEEVEFAKQKPQPDGLLMCIEELTKLSPGNILYIGDHETDAQCASNVNKVLKDRNINIEVLSVGIFHSDNVDDSHWTIKPKFKANSAEDILRIINDFG